MIVESWWVLWNGRGKWANINHQDHRSEKISGDFRRYILYMAQLTQWL